MRYAWMCALVLLLTRAPAAQGTWTDLGGGLGGITGIPVLVGEGSLKAGDLASLTLTNAAANAHVLLFISEKSHPINFKGGALQAFPPLLIIDWLSTDDQGGITLEGTWPGAHP